ncbi:MAG: imelysin family protein [Alphaproteobacteria bacterium]
MRPWLGRIAAASLLIATGAAEAATPDNAAVIKAYADIAQAAYADSLSTAKTLQKAVNALIAKPSADTMKAARTAWLKARVPYMQTEAFRFGNPIVDEWEGKVNAWPLDEGLIDYVDPSYGTESAENPLFTANVIANTSIKIGGETVDAAKIDAELLADKLQEAGGVEANVATGYHAVEFLLWGQDLNGTGPGAGMRSWTDYSKTKCTNGHCDRRAAYLKAATDLLVQDLAWMVEQWGPKGEARQELMKEPSQGIAAMLTGLGSLSYGELAGERMKLGLMLHDPEEEHDCFSDNTHNSHYYDVMGMLNVYFGTYKRPDGSTVKGPSLSALVAAKDASADKALSAALKKSEATMRALKTRAEKGEAYDQMIGDNNPGGNAVVQAAIDSLTAQTKAIEGAVAALGLQPIAFEGSDSLDNPASVFK